MAKMLAELNQLVWKLRNERLFLLIGTVLALPILYFLLLDLLKRPVIPSNAPKRRNDDWPILGAIKFYTSRWDFFKDDMSNFPNGTMSFHIGKHLVVAATGVDARKVFLEERSLRLGEAYAVLFGHSPGIEPHLDDDADATSEERLQDESVANMGEFNAWFNNRMAAALRTQHFQTNLPAMIQDVWRSLDDIAADPSGLTDPFRSVYGMIFQLTFRMLGCAEVADDDVLRVKILSLYESLESNSGLSMVILPWWMPSPKILGRFWSGARLYMAIQSIVEKRQTGKSKRQDDTLQVLIDHGDKTDKIIRFIISVVYSGQVNTGLNAAYLLCFLATNPASMQKAREEISSILEKYDSDATKSLLQRLHSVPLSAWETEFPFIELCLRESIRLTLHGTAFRWNPMKREIPLGGQAHEVLPAGAFMAYHMHDVHRDPDIYRDPELFDPERFADSRAEDQKVPYAFLGWGAARHPCPGQRFARFEVTLITASFLSRFDDFHICNKRKDQLDVSPMASPNSVVTTPPESPVFIAVHKEKRHPNDGIRTA